MRLHDLQHLHATQLLAAGIPVRTVSGRLGHANAATTLNVYAHFSKPAIAKPPTSMAACWIDHAAHADVVEASTADVDVRP